MKTRFAALVVCLLALVSFAQLVSATTVLPPTFDQLVDEAQVVFLGQVAAKRSRWANEPLGRAIVTDVTFRVEDVFKGDAPSHVVLEFLGGSLDEYEFRVSEMTDFAIGDRDVLFLESREQRPSPLVGMNYGRFAVMRDGVRGIDTIADFAGQPLVSLQQIGAPEPDDHTSVTAQAPDPDTQVTAPVGVPMTLGSFARAIRARVQAAGERRPQ
jgi:hypothetical protein